MSRSLLAGALLLVAGLYTGVAPSGQPAKKVDRPKVEVVFCLDTTGSMGGLIDAAKQKIWAISNQIAGGKPNPHLRIGLVAYRDRGDEYVTKVFDLTDDLDTVYSNLMTFRAAGGGDLPESVNQALHESVTKLSWSKDKKTLKIIFLVGDAPPKHYADDVQYQTTCKLAVTNDIIINTIQCGDHPETKKYWLDICRLAEGSYAQIDAKGGPVVVVATPFDEELAKINTELARSTVTFGDKDSKAKGKKAAKGAETLPPGAAADRAGLAGAGGIRASYDLIDQIKAGKVKLTDLKTEDLPVEMQKLTLKEREEYLAKIDKQRTELTRRASELDKQRQTFIAKKLAESKEGQARDSFDGQVLRILQTQARRVNIEYATDQKKEQK
jgi:Mg-chelatase subunit ChlD